MIRLTLYTLLALGVSVYAEQPNLVLLFLDDHGWADVGCNDPSTKETPNIDRLAASGVRFTDWHAAASVCTPSRAGLLTGRLGMRTGVVRNFGVFGVGGIPWGELTVADLVRSGGYDAHMLGKWHLGFNAPFHPTYRGFQTWYGLPYSGDMPVKILQNTTSDRMHCIAQLRLGSSFLLSVLRFLDRGCLDMTPQSCKPGVNRADGHPECPSLCDMQNATVGIPLYDASGPNCTVDGKNEGDCDATIVEQPVDEFSLNSRYAARAEQIIAAYGRGERWHGPHKTSSDRSDGRTPFLLYVGWAHTHTPMAYDATKWANASSRPGWKKQFGNTLAEVDSAIGRVVAALEAAGLSNDTLVVLTSDNGPADLGEVDCDFIGSPGPFVGAWQTETKGGATLKTQLWEGGHRMVGVAAWPGRIAAGRTSSALVSSLDVTPTFAALAGVELPDDRHFDGIDLSPVLFPAGDEAAAGGHKVLFHPCSGGACIPGSLDAMRYGDLKLFYRSCGTQACDHGSKPKPVEILQNTFSDRTRCIAQLRPGSSFLLSALRFFDRPMCIKHETPLAFNVSADPGERTPVDVPAAVLRAAAAAREAKLADIAASLKHVANYTKGGHSAAPCCNADSWVCRCAK